MTPGQRQLLDAISRLTTAESAAPSLQQLADELGTHKSNVHRALHMARAAGLIHFQSHASRTIVILTDNPAYARPALEALLAPALWKLRDLAAQIIDERKITR